MLCDWIMLRSLKSNKLDYNNTRKPRLAIQVTTMRFPNRNIHNLFVTWYHIINYKTQVQCTPKVSEFVTISITSKSPNRNLNKCGCQSVICFTPFKTKFTFYNNHYNNLQEQMKTSKKMASSRFQTALHRKRNQHRVTAPLWNTLREKQT